MPAVLILTTGSDSSTSVRRLRGTNSVDVVFHGRGTADVTFAAEASATLSLALAAFSQLGTNSAEAAENDLVLELRQEARALAGVMQEADIDLQYEEFLR